MKKLFIISGGEGREREVSLASGKNCIEIVRDLGIDYEEMIAVEGKNFLFRGDRISEEDALKVLKEQNALVFQVIHGTYGEDGDFIRKLEEKGVSYIGSSSLVQKKTLNKYATEQYLKEERVPTTTSVLISSNSITTKDVTFPSIVKPNNEGSSIGVVMVNNTEELQNALRSGMKDYKELLVQPRINGREVTCGVIEMGRETVALPVTEIVLTKGEMFAYQAKYSVGGCLEVTPADLDAESIRKIQQTALKTHNLMGCKDISRTDMFLAENGEVVVLEINTVPGMTKTSFIPAQLSAAGHTLGDFVRGMLEKYS
jgi:D-alanine-D-alanine ligase